MTYFITDVSWCAYVEWYIDSENRHDMNDVRPHVLLGSENVITLRKESQ